MFESFLAVPLHFTIEFIGFLVTAGAALLMLSRSDLIPGPVADRRVAALGFALIAAAQVAHGGGFAAGDGNPIVVALTALGFAAVAAGVVGWTGSGGASAISLQEPTLIAPAATALVLAGGALVRSRRQGPRSLGWLALAALLLACGELLSGVAPDVRFGVGDVDPYAYAAHGVRLLGFAALGGWLWAGVRSSIRSRFVVSFAALLVTVVMALASALTGVISEDVEREELERVSVQLEGAIDKYREDAQDLTDTAQQLAGNADVQAAFAARASLEQVAGNLVDVRLLDADFIVFASPRGQLLGAAGDAPATSAGDAPSGGLPKSHLVEVLLSPVVGEASRPAGSFTAGIDRLARSTLATLGAARVPAPQGGGRASGVVVVGRYIDALSLQELARDVAPAKASIVLDGRAVLSDLPPEAADRRLIEGGVRDELRDGDVVTREQTLGDRSYFSAFAPLPLAVGRDTGQPVLVLSSPARLASATRLDVTRLLFLVAMGVGVVALALAWLFGRRITKPIQILTESAGAVREGDLSVRVPVAGRDEVGQLGSTFNEMTEALRVLTGDLREAAGVEQRLRTRLETIIQSMADGLVAVDSDRKVLAFNSSAERLTGTSADAAVGKPVQDVLEVRNAQGEKASLAVYELSEGSASEIFVSASDGKLVPVAVTSAVLHGEGGQVTGGVAVIRDMTREHEVEKMKSAFLSNISHELRTPLTPIRGYAEILGAKQVPVDQAKKFASGIVESTERLERIVELLVDFSAMEAGRLSPRARLVDVGPMLEALVTEWNGKSAHHEVVADINGRLPKVMGDERLLRRSLEEVLDNAMKFSPAGGRIEVSARDARSEDGNGNRALEVTISDEGIGIPSEEEARIFSDFHQLDASETRTYGGLGLGLAFVRRIVEAHDGRVTVESQPERGTRLTITVPAARPA
jgi:two-component system, OmpR family, phosphate regulon sensor histidine kinase PhoR